MRILLCLGGMLLALGLSAQSVSEGTLPEEARFLTESDDLFREDVALTESLLDMVVASVQDSVVTKRRQHLIGFIGFVGRMGARYWQYMDDHKRKYVGTMSRSYKVYEGFGDEADMNIFLIPHIPHYVQMVSEGFETAFRKGRSEKHFRYDQPPYPCPEELWWKDLGYLTVECEGTPPEAYRWSMDSLFIPTGEGKHPLENHPHFGRKYPSVGLYGTWCMDCNHNCRPEIHPIEWLWWLDMAPDSLTQVHEKTWMVGLIPDGSRRFEEWSPAPRTGEIALPIAFPLGAQEVRINLEVLLADPIDGERPPQAYGLPETGAWSSEAPLQLEVAGQKVRVVFEGPDDLPFLQCWTSDWTYDADKGLVLGRFHMGVSEVNLYTSRVRVYHH